MSSSRSYLLEIDCLQVLPQLFGTIFIPSLVYSELQHPNAPELIRASLKLPPAWLKIMPTPLDTSDPWLAGLDSGEKAALLLGMDLQADLIVIDERRGTAAARAKGFASTGTLGILLLASQRNMLNLAEAFARLRRTSFHCSEQILEELLARETNRLKS